MGMERSKKQKLSEKKMYALFFEAVSLLRHSGRMSSCPLGPSLMSI